MNVNEAKALLLSELGRYRLRTYAELRERLGTQDDFEAAAPSGTKYAIEVDFFWDDKRGGDIRVMGAIDDGSPRYACLPLVESFILAPDGHFVDEDAAESARCSSHESGVNMRQDPPKLDYASPRPESEEPEVPEKTELQRALSFMGVMFMAVAAFNFIAHLRHGPDGLALLVGLLGLALFICSRVVKR